MTTPRLRARILLVEDDDRRVAHMMLLVPPWVRIVRASSAARAIGIIERDGDLRSDTPPAYAGVMLDHDLDLQPINAADKAMNGTDVARALAARFSPDLPVFIHSTNSGGSAAMMDILRGRGFDVVRHSWMDLQDAPAPLVHWFEEVLEIWKDSQE
jgi:CheY-like chemotaxis protein